MIKRIVEHTRTTWRLLRSPRVNGWLKLVFAGTALVYLLNPYDLLPDVLPVVGLIDDAIVCGAASVLFRWACPRDLTVAAPQREAASALEAHRDPDEAGDLGLGFAACALALMLGGSALGLVLVASVFVAVLWAMFQQRLLLANAVRVSDRQLAGAHAAFQRAREALPAVDASVLVVNNPVPNAYALGVRAPYMVVLHSGLVERLNERELQAVIGHELGHIVLGHTRQNGLLGIGRGSLADLAFWKWRRTCEYSCDAVAVLASQGDRKIVLSSLLKLASGLREPASADDFLEQVTPGGDWATRLLELSRVHPHMANRVRRLIEQPGQEAAS